MRKTPRRGAVVVGVDVVVSGGREAWRNSWWAPRFQRYCGNGFPQPLAGFRSSRRANGPAISEAWPRRRRTLPRWADRRQRPSRSWARPSRRFPSRRRGSGQCLPAALRVGLVTRRRFGRRCRRSCGAGHIHQAARACPLRPVPPRSVPECRPGPPRRTASCRSSAVVMAPLW